AGKRLRHLFPVIPTRDALHKRRLRLSGQIEALIAHFARQSPGSARRTCRSSAPDRTRSTKCSVSRATRGVSTARPAEAAAARARTVGDLTLMLTAIAGPHRGSPLSHGSADEFADAPERQLRGLRVAWCPTSVGFRLSPRSQP
ncbi:MAG: hypothetical protein ACYCSI_03475, partial [Solirubrobacteraceae bacterium]